MSEADELAKYEPVIAKVIEKAPLHDYGRDDIRAWKVETLEQQPDAVKADIRVSLMGTGVEMGNVVPIRDMNAVVELTYQRMLDTLRG